MAKISIFKTTADGEQVNFEVDLTKEHLDAMKPTVEREKNLVTGDMDTRIVPGKSLREIFDYAFRLADDRLLEMNKRIMASNVMVKKLPVEGQMAITNIMEVLHGRSNGPAPEAILEEARLEREAAAKKLAESVPE